MEYNPIIEDKGEQQECLYCGYETNQIYCSIECETAGLND